jgi:DNA-damage-inducible protein J
MTTITNKGAIIQVRVNAQVKKNAQKALKGMGLDISTAVNMLLHQVVISQRMPFESRTINGFTPAQEQEYLAAAKEAMTLRGGKLYKTVEEMMDDI